MRGHAMIIVTTLAVQRNTTVSVVDHVWYSHLIPSWFAKTWKTFEQSFTFTRGGVLTHVTTHGSESQQRLGGEDGDRRLSISEWKERVVKQEDGTLIIIKGPKTVTQ